jgi:hypothetical protein
MVQMNDAQCLTTAKTNKNEFVTIFANNHAHISYVLRIDVGVLIFISAPSLMSSATLTCHNRSHIFTVNTEDDNITKAHVCT